MDDKLYAEMQAESDRWRDRCFRAEDRLHRLWMLLLIFVLVPVAFFVVCLICERLVR